MFPQHHERRNFNYLCVEYGTAEGNSKNLQQKRMEINGNIIKDGDEWNYLNSMKSEIKDYWLWRVCVMVATVKLEYN